MEIWLDTIDRYFLESGKNIAYGVTTNPSILSKSKDVCQTLDELLTIQKGPVAVQVTKDDAEGMIEEAKLLYNFSNRIIVKIPSCKNGYEATYHLKQHGVPVLATAVINPPQALLAANSGALYVTPYFSQMGDLFDQATENLTTIVRIVKNYHPQTKILVASLRSVNEILFCAKLGVDAITIKEELFNDLLSPPPSLEKILDKFKSHWKIEERSLKDILLSNRN